MPKKRTKVAAPKALAKKGGEARALSLSKEERSNIARAAALTRWGAEGKAAPAVAKYGAVDRPLKIGDIEIPCFVLEDGRRVFTQSGLQQALGLSKGGGKDGSRRIAGTMASLSEKGLDVRDLVDRANEPIQFYMPHGGKPAMGHEAMMLPDICDVLIEAGRRDLLHSNQKSLAKQAAILQHGFATVGIIALVDEATGYQDVRGRDALAKILERFVAKELKPWVSTFPPDYYKQIYRMNAWSYDPENNGRPGVLGHWTNNIVYARLAPGVLAELKKVVPKDKKGRHKAKLFQALTDDFGHPKLREHLAGVVMLMKYSPNWKVFMARLDDEYPQHGDTLMLPFPADYVPPPASDTDVDVAE